MERQYLMDRVSATTGSDDRAVAPGRRSGDPACPGGATPVPDPGGRAGRVAAIVLAYGDSPFLPGCLKSLIVQTRPAFVAIATSTPSEFISRTAAELAVPVVINPERRGIAADWNFALQAVDAEYVTLAHQDDCYHPAFFSETLKAFGRGPNAAVCFTGYQEIDGAGRSKSSKISRVKHLIEFATIGRREIVGARRLRAFLSFGNPLPCSSVTFNRSRLPDFEFSADYSSNLDWEAWWRLATSGETVLHVPKRLVGRRHNRLTATSRLIADGTRRREDFLMFRAAWPRPFADAIAWAYRAGY